MENKYYKRNFVKRFFVKYKDVVSMIFNQLSKAKWLIVKRKEFEDNRSRSLMTQIYINLFPLFIKRIQHYYISVKRVKSS